MAEIVGKEQAGTALGLGLSLLQIGVLVFPPTFGLIVDYSGNYTMSWVGLGCLVIAFMRRSFSPKFSARDAKKLV